MLSLQKTDHHVPKLSGALTFCFVLQLRAWRLASQTKMAQPSSIGSALEHPLCSLKVCIFAIHVFPYD